MHIADAAGTPSDDEHTNLCIESRYTDDFTGSANNGMAGLSLTVNNNVNLDGTTTVGGSQYINEGQINYMTAQMVTEMEKNKVIYNLWFQIVQEQYQK